MTYRLFVRLAAICRQRVHHSVRDRRGWRRLRAAGLAVLLIGLLAPSLLLANNVNPRLMGGPGHPLAVQPEGAAVAAPSAHLTYYGGRVVSNLQVVQVLYGPGSYASKVRSTSSPSMATFYQGVLNSPYVDWLGEYDTSIPAAGGAAGTNQSIGRGSFVGQYLIAPSPANSGPAIDDGQIQSELAAQIMAGHLPAPSSDAGGNNNTYYAIFFPHGVTIFLDDFDSCYSFCAYHGTVANVGGHEIYYGVHPDMQSGSGCERGCGRGTQFQRYTAIAAHEMVETITDGEVGLTTQLGAPLAWYDSDNGEVGDICVGHTGTVVGADGVTYTVQAEWSNAANACIVTGPCGNGILDPGEQCDDGNAVNGDGCSVRCRIEPCHTCSGQPSTCVPVTDATPCDDGVFCNGAADTCSHGTCSVHAGDPCAGGPACANVCNEAARNCLAPDGTQCVGPDPNTCMNACRAGACTPGAPVTQTACCGNGVLDAGEQCDDGNVTTGDGCEASCTFGGGFALPFTQCPAIGAATGCQVLLNVTASGTVNVLADVAQGSFNGNADDTLIGVQNNSSQPVTAIALSSALPIFAFDFDGLCNSFGAPAGCPFGPTRYEGPGVSFAPTNPTSGIVHFAAGIPPGGSAYFSLEEALSWGQLAAQVSVCGNGIVTAGEQCDDGNANDNDACRNNCTRNVCGDGVLNLGVEQCDDGNANDNDACRNDCTRNVCGDGVLNVGVEHCDDGNLVDGDGCDSNCTITACGNGIRTAGEQCDDGNFVNGDGCDFNCTVTGCGNGIRTAGEQCDDGNLTAGDGCDASCLIEAGWTCPVAGRCRLCGNGIIEPGEQCDDGNLADGDGCDSNCTFTGCGNGIVTAGEQCDDGNTNNSDACKNDCTLGTVPRFPQCPAIGSGTGCQVLLNVTSSGAVNVLFDRTQTFSDSDDTLIGVQNDSGQTIPSFTLSSSLKIFGFDGDGLCNIPFGRLPVGCPFGPTGYEGPGVVFTPHDVQSGLVHFASGIPPGGSAYFSLEETISRGQLAAQVSVCGNGVLDAGEQCDDGNLNPNDACTNDCTFNVCGDGILYVGVEQCDDGNASDNDACKNGCTLNVCGDGILNAGVEQCDDGNPADGDGCDSNCTLTACGNGVVTAGEQCDDGNTSNNDACKNGCTLNVCGDGALNVGVEQCDDGNLANGDGCETNCMFTGGPTVPFTQCPVIGAANGCQVLLHITASGTVLVLVDLAQTGFDDDNTLIGVQNDYGEPVTGINLSSSREIFEFDADGICNTSGKPAGCPFGPTGYEGPGVAFGPHGLTSGSVRFAAGIPPGGSAYFSLEWHLSWGQLAAQANLCGNRIQDAGEQCDDGNFTDGDGCDSNCTPTRCGNGVISAEERCDDGNLTAGDGCDASCIMEAGWTCLVAGQPCMSVCGDGLVRGSEQCDDGNRVDGDGCDSNCTLTGCGNFIVTAGELCDDGNLVSGDGCSSTCQIELDHFQCNRSTILAAQPSIAPVTLADALTRFSARVRRLNDLCTPTNKNGEDPAAASHPDHLESYTIVPEKAQQLRNALPLRNQEVVNQFGTLRLDVTWPNRLLVPTLASFTAVPPVPVSPAVDHFTCYRVKRTKHTPAFTPMTLTVEDEFGPGTVTVGHPLRLCMPTSKNDEAPDAYTHSGRLLCYHITRRPLSIGRVLTNNQFGPGIIYPGFRDELCVPSVVRR